MVFLHITAINNELTSGVDVAVSQHIQAHSFSEEVAVVNINNTPMNFARTQFEYRSDFDLNTLPSPFSAPDLVVFHNVYYIQYITISRMLQKRGIPYIIIPHGALAATAQRKKWLKKAAANVLFFNRFFRSAAAIQFLSEREMSVSKYNTKGFIGPNGINLPDVTGEAKQRDSIRIVYIGRMEIHIKGLDLMIEAIGKCRELFAENRVRLELYGPDCQEGHTIIRALITKHKVAEYVTLHDAVVGEEKRRVLLDSDMFIQTSRTEGMPMGLLEALSYGLPCIVTEGTSLGGIIRKYDAGWVADTKSTCIAEAIAKAVESRSLWCEKSKQARRLVFENYNWEKVVTDTVREYKSIAGRN